MKAVTVVVEALTVEICGTDAEITSGGRVRVAVHVHVGEDAENASRRNRMS